MLWLYTSETFAMCIQRMCGHGKTSLKIASACIRRLGEAPIESPIAQNNL